MDLLFRIEPPQSCVNVTKLRLLSNAAPKGYCSMFVTEPPTILFRAKAAKIVSSAYFFIYTLLFDIGQCFSSVDTLLNRNQVKKT